MLKAVILIGGPQKGTRFRPLSLDIPKPLFPVAGLPLIQHHIEALATVPTVKEILLIGYYPAQQMQEFVNNVQQHHSVVIRYLQEFTTLGTAGGMYHFRDQIRCGNPEAFFVMNGDVCADFPLTQLYEFHKQRKERALVTIMAAETTKQQSLQYGCMVIDKDTFEVKHYVEKPNTYISTWINCGVYVCSMEVFQRMAQVFNSKEQDYSRHNGNGKDAGFIQFEQDVLAPLAGTGQVFALEINFSSWLQYSYNYQLEQYCVLMSECLNNKYYGSVEGPTEENIIISVGHWWSQLKTACAAIYANRHYLQLYKSSHPERLATNTGDGSCTIYPDVHIHPTATVHPSATIGPNVSIGANVVISPGVRIRESIILAGATVEDHSLVLHSIIGRNSRVGKWARVEGTPSDPDPNKPFAKMENPPLFNSEGKLNPSITILGCFVTVPSETILLNSIVLPHKELSRSFKNEIIL